MAQKYKADKMFVKSYSAKRNKKQTKKQQQKTNKKNKKTTTNKTNRILPEREWEEENLFNPTPVHHLVINTLSFMFTLVTDCLHRLYHGGVTTVTIIYYNNIIKQFKKNKQYQLW